MLDQVRLNLRVLAGVSLLLLRQKSSRRKIMFYTSMVMIAMVFGGALFLTSMLSNSPLIFLGYLLLCLGGTMFMLLLAVYDILIIRKQHRSEMAKLRRRVADAIATAKSDGESRGEK